MRFLRLDYRDDLRALDLHPLISVVSITEADKREHLLEAVRRLSTGSTSGLRGLVEHDGLLVELDPIGGEPLSETCTSATVVAHVDAVDPDDDGSSLHREIERWERQAAIDSATVEEIRSHIDLSVRARARQLQRRLEPPRPTSTSPAMTTARLRARAVRRALDAVTAIPAVIPRSSPEIEDLIERWERYRERRTTHEPHLVELAAQVAEAERAVALATERMAEARERARPVMLAPADEARLEELFELSHESSLWRKGLNSDEEAEMQALLHSVGVASWTEYSVLRMSPTVPSDKEAEVLQAEQDLETAREHLETVRIERVEDEVTSSLRDELRSIKADCQPFLGVLVPSDIGWALNQLLDMVENPEWLEALNALRDTLSSNDLHPPGGIEPEEIIGWADSWLQAQESLQVPARSAPEPVENEIEIRLELEAESQLLVRHDRAMGQIDRAERGAARSGLRVDQLRSQLRERIDGPPPRTAADVMAIIDPIAEQVLNDIGGSVPLAVVGEFGHLPTPEIDALMEALEEVAERVQVIVVSTNPAVTDWASRVGLERADLQAGLSTRL